MLCSLKCSDICDCVTNCVTLQVTAEQKHRKPLRPSAGNIYLFNPGRVQHSFPKLQHTHLQDNLTSVFHFLTPAPPPPPLIQALVGKYFTQESDIATLNQTCKRKRMPDKRLPQLCRKQILTNKHKVSVMIMRITWTWSEVLFANLLLYSLPF